ncbi:MAG TPA: cyclic pyranopterin monophosphate synthase MoaC [Gemmatimonadota bacterium]
MTRSTHLDPAGHARMVDVSEKAPSRRVARASGAIRMSAEALAAVARGELPKGDAFAVARVAGIQAAKHTPDLVPLCHPLALDHVSIEIHPDDSLPGVRVRSEVVVTARTGAEMEALSAVAGALLSIYDMAKALDRTMSIEEVRLESKAGGRSGDWSRRGPSE